MFQKNKPIFIVIMLSLLFVAGSYFITRFFGEKALLAVLIFVVILILIRDFKNKKRKK